MIPSWILDIFAAIMLVVAAVSAARLIAARPWQQRRRRAALADIDIAHLLMGIAMAGMLVSGLRTLPNGVWEVVFGVMTAWFGYRVARDAPVSGVRALAGGHCAPHLIHATAMLYMYLALAAPAGRSGMGGMGARPGMGGMSVMGTLELPFLAFLFALALVGYGIWDLDQLSGPGTSGHYSLAAARAAPAGAMLAGVTAGAATGPGAAASGPAGAAAASQHPPPTSVRRKAVPGFSPRGSPPAAGSRWASP